MAYSVSKIHPSDPPVQVAISAPSSHGEVILGKQIVSLAALKSKETKRRGLRGSVAPKCGSDTDHSVLRGGDRLIGGRRKISIEKSPAPYAPAS
jgi:hypothetical protein